MGTWRKRSDALQQQPHHLALLLLMVSASRRIATSGVAK